MTFNIGLIINPLAGLGGSVALKGSDDVASEALALGAVPKKEPSASAYEVLTIGIKTDKEELRQRFAARAQEWLKNGFQEKVERLLSDGVTRARLQEIGFEYVLMLEYIDGKLTEPEFIQKFIEKNWQYAKRQIMWLKRDKDIQWFNSANNIEISKRTRQFLCDE